MIYQRSDIEITMRYQCFPTSFLDNVLATYFPFIIIQGYALLIR